MVRTMKDYGGSFHNMDITHMLEFSYGHRMSDSSYISADTDEEAIAYGKRILSRNKDLYGMTVYKNTGRAGNGIVTFKVIFDIETED